NIVSINFLHYSFALLLLTKHFSLPPASLDDRFLYASQLPSVLSTRAMNIEEAELAYVQKGTSNDVIVQGPDGQGVFTLFPANIRFRAPVLEILFTDPSIRLEVLGGSKSRIRFRLFKPAGLFSPRDLRPFISTVLLNA